MPPGMRLYKLVQLLTVIQADEFYHYTTLSPYPTRPGSSGRVSGATAFIFASGPRRPAPDGENVPNDCIRGSSKLHQNCERCPVAEAHPPTRCFSRRGVLCTPAERPQAAPMFRSEEHPQKNYNPKRSPAQRVRFGEEGQGSGANGGEAAAEAKADFAPTRSPLHPTIDIDPVGASCARPCIASSENFPAGDHRSPLRSVRRNIRRKTITQSEAQRSGFGLERRGKGAVRMAARQPPKQKRTLPRRGRPYILFPKIGVPRQGRNCM